MPNQMNPMDMINMLMQRNPNVANNARNREFMKVLQSGNQQEIENLANKICQTYGITPEQALQQLPGFQQQYCGPGMMIPNIPMNTGFGTGSRR